jgi:hypothetical protein
MFIVFNAKWAIIMLFNGENKSYFIETMMKSVFLHNQHA